MGQGARFEIYLPASSEAKAPDAALEPPPLPTGHGELILVVADEEAIREIVKAALEQHGYRVLTASDGTGAVVLLAQERKNVRAVVCDMAMPVMDGPATIRALWALEPGLPIIGATGHTSQVGEERIRELNLKALLMKPFSARELLVTLHEMLHPKPPAG